MSCCPNQIPTRVSCSISFSNGGDSKGLLIHAHRSLYAKRLYRSMATRFDNDHSKVDRNFRYFKIRIAINAVQICIRSALGLVPTNVLILRFCLMVLKKPQFASGLCKLLRWSKPQSLDDLSKAQLSACYRHPILRFS